MSKVVDCSECNVSFKTPEGSCFNCPYEISEQYIEYVKKQPKKAREWLRK